MTKSLTVQAKYGSPEVWQTVFTCKGQKRNLTGAENIQALAAGGTISGTIWIRWRPVNIKTGWRIVCEGKNINIISVLDTLLPEGRFWKIQIKEVA
jgi:SPP1 family predicted phage head-tail adaptor